MPGRIPGVPPEGGVQLVPVQRQGARADRLDNDERLGLSAHLPFVSGAVASLPHACELSFALVNVGPQRSIEAMPRVECKAWDAGAGDRLTEGLI